MTSAAANARTKSKRPPIRDNGCLLIFQDATRRAVRRSALRPRGPDLYRIIAGMRANFASPHCRSGRLAYVLTWDVAALRGIMWSRPMDRLLECVLASFIRTGTLRATTPR